MDDLKPHELSALTEFALHCDTYGNIIEGDYPSIRVPYSLVMKGYVSGIPLLERLNGRITQPRLLEKGLKWRLVSNDMV